MEYYLGISFVSHNLGGWWGEEWHPGINSKGCMGGGAEKLENPCSSQSWPNLRTMPFLRLWPLLTYPLLKSVSVFLGLFNVAMKGLMLNKVGYILSEVGGDQTLNDKTVMSGGGKWRLISTVLNSFRAASLALPYIHIYQLILILPAIPFFFLSPPHFWETPVYIISPTKKFSVRLG